MGDVIIFHLNMLISCVCFVVFIDTRALGTFHARATIPFFYVYPSSCHQLVVTVHKYRWKKKKKKKKKRWNHRKRISFLSNWFVRSLNEEINPWGGKGKEIDRREFSRHLPEQENSSKGSLPYKFRVISWLWWGGIVFVSFSTLNHDGGSPLGQSVIRNRKEDGDGPLLVISTVITVLSISVLSIWISSIWPMDLKFNIEHRISSSL